MKKRNKLKNWLKSYKDESSKKVRENQKEIDKDLDFLGVDFFNFLKFIFRKDNVHKEILIKKFGENQFNLFKDMAVPKEYLISSRGEKIYQITNKGIDFLLNSRKLQKEEKNSNVIKWATLVMAISAFVQIVDILVTKPTTKEALIALLGKSIAIILSIVKGLIPIAILIGIIVLIVKIVNSLREKKK